MISLMSNSKEKWERFKLRNNNWLWDRGEDEEPGFGQNFMIDLYNKCGLQIFRHYQHFNQNVNI